MSQTPTIETINWSTDKRQGMIEPSNNATENDMSTTRLHGIGTHQAKVAAKLKAGDVIVWNFGSTSEVVAVTPGTKTVVVSLAGGYTRRFNALRLVAVQ